MSDKYFEGNLCEKPGHGRTRYKNGHRCVACCQEWCREYRASGRRKRDREKECAYQKKKYHEELKHDADYKARKAEYDREYRKKNAERLDAQKAVWRENNADLMREVKRAYKHRRRAQESAGLTGRGVLEWKKGVAQICYWCGDKDADEYHVDHYKPLARGGKHEVENLVLACRFCNQSKNARNPYEFAGQVGRLF